MERRFAHGKWRSFVRPCLGFFVISFSTSQSKLCRFAEAEEMSRRERNYLTHKVFHPVGLAARQILKRKQIMQHESLILSRVLLIHHESRGFTRMPVATPNIKASKEHRWSANSTNMYLLPLPSSSNRQREAEFDARFRQLRSINYSSTIPTTEFVLPPCPLSPLSPSFLGTFIPCHFAPCPLPLALSLCPFSPCPWTPCPRLLALTPLPHFPYCPMLHPCFWTHCPVPSGSRPLSSLPLPFFHSAPLPYLSLSSSVDSIRGRTAANSEEVVREITWQSKTQDRIVTSQSLDSSSRIMHSI